MASVSSCLPSQRSDSLALGIPVAAAIDFCLAVRAQAAKLGDKLAQRALRPLSASLAMWAANQALEVLDPVPVRRGGVAGSPLRQSGAVAGISVRAPNQSTVKLKWGLRTV